MVRQRPPAYSAVKIKGQRAYKLARAGESFEMPEREVTVYRFEETRREGAERDFVIECSSGTYVRSLIADLGDAYCTALRRTRIGDFDVEDADPERLLPLEQALRHIPGAGHAIDHLAFLTPMRVTPLSDVEPRPRRVAVGEFDGVHVGHREVIAGNDTVLTFEPHPAAVVKPDRAPKLLTSLDVKIELIAELGVEELVIVPFDDAFAHRGASEFVDAVLVGRAGRDARVRRGELPVRARDHGRRCAAGRRRPLRDARGADGASRRRDSVLDADPDAGRRRRGGGGGAPAGRAIPDAR